MNLTIALLGEKIFPQITTKFIVIYNTDFVLFDKLERYKNLRYGNIITFFSIRSGKTFKNDLIMNRA